MRLLATTPFQETWGKEEEILFLGEWCRTYHSRNIWGNRNHQTVRYHCDDREKLRADENKYDDFIVNNYSCFDIGMTKNELLSKQIAESDVVVGCRSYAMAIALQADKKVISVLPPRPPERELPFNEIIHLRKYV